MSERREGAEQSTETRHATGSPDGPWSSERDITEAVVTATAEATGMDPLEMDPLYATVDPDALESLVGGPGDDARVTVAFDFNGCRITVHRGGRIEVDEP